MFKNEDPLSLLYQPEEKNVSSSLVKFYSIGTNQLFVKFIFIILYSFTIPQTFSRATSEVILLKFSMKLEN